MPLSISARLHLTADFLEIVLRYLLVSPKFDNEVSSILYSQHNPVGTNPIPCLHFMSPHPSKIQLQTLTFKIVRHERKMRTNSLDSSWRFVVSSLPKVQHLRETPEQTHGVQIFGRLIFLKLNTADVRKNPLRVKTLSLT